MVSGLNMSHHGTINTNSKKHVRKLFVICVTQLTDGLLLKKLKYFEVMLNTLTNIISLSLSIKILYLKGYKWLLSQNQRVRNGCFGCRRYEALVKQIKPFLIRTLK